MRSISSLAFFLVLLLGQSALAAERWTLAGRVTSIDDGDSLTLQDTRKQAHRIRLEGIDAPELAQPFGKTARRILRRSILHRHAEASCHKTDPYGRAVCRLTVDGKDAGLLQLEAGMAWLFKRYVHELPPARRQIYERSERRARSQRLGLWADPRPQPPWEWRASQIQPHTGQQN